MRNILLTLSYDGTGFCGWQRQDCKDGKYVRTVQGELEKTLAKLLGQPVNLYGSGRTDSGVHAAGQAANFFSPITSIPPENYVRVLNGMLPPDIRVMESREVPEDFNSRFSATSRVYRYYIYCGDVPLASQMPFVWRIRHACSIDRLNAMVSSFRGETDCKTFSAAGDQSLSTRRYIEDAFFFEQPGWPSGTILVFQIEANAFLWKMVRSVIGSLIEFERTGRSADYFSEVLAAGNRKLAGPTAPPTGLFLWQVKFDGIRRHA
ncbi:MAG: tRNA pseudouridine(38-40) synthase TruA [Treponema sp.]|jgi:tRNA pseudouridine38-40 synthase|nr:tRNA pseudouridine(38-40) synthase TruA [Treponema sp.]